MLPIRKVSLFDGKMAFQLESIVAGCVVKEMNIAMIHGIPMVNIYLQKDKYINLWKSYPLQICSLEYDLEWGDSI